MIYKFSIKKRSIHISQGKKISLGLKKKLINFREREISCSVYLCMHLLLLLHVWLGIKPITLVYQNDALNKLATWARLKNEQQLCWNAGSNQGPLDLQFNVLPTELFQSGHLLILNICRSGKMLCTLAYKNVYVVKIK